MRMSENEVPIFGREGCISVPFPGRTHLTHIRGSIQKEESVDGGNGMLLRCAFKTQVFIGSEGSRNSVGAVQRTQKPEGSSTTVVKEDLAIAR